VQGEIGNGVAKPPRVRTGGNSGYQAIGLAILFGAARVILLGYDMQRTGDRTHWHGDHIGLGNPKADRLRLWCSNFKTLALQAPVPIINASRETALDCFPRADLHDCLAESAAQHLAAA
jgi:hypothetical protein